MDTEPVPKSPIRIDFGPGIYGLDYIRTDGKYYGEVYSKNIGNGPTCLNSQGEKTYTLRSGNVDGVYTDGNYIVHELDLREAGIPFDEMRDPKKLAKIIQARQNQIKSHKLVVGEACKIPGMVLHQPCGKGILQIKVDSGYVPETVIESDDIDLSSFVKNYT
ncbi:hypothetical protein C4577_07010 [Candidatus Parcubacteria bacterium]|nr:MAG: hypothetical protein C4577_07010 [Candidatus Parcubacteria bacterium]